MTIYSSTITFGSVTLLIDRISVSKVPSTLKQVVGMRLIERSIPSRVLQDWQITIEGRHIDTSRDTDRNTLQSYDDLKTHTFTDGAHDGEYFITSLEYTDEGDNPVSYKFALKLIQEQS